MVLPVDYVRNGPEQEVEEYEEVSLCMCGTVFFQERSVSALTGEGCWSGGAAGLGIPQESWCVESEGQSQA